MGCVRVRGFGHVMLGSPDITLRVNGKDYIFEFSERFGPLFTNKRGSEVASPSTRCVFWSALYLWIQQGKRMNGSICLWEPIEMKDIVEHISGNMYKVVGSEMGAPDWYIPEAAL